MITKKYWGLFGQHFSHASYTESTKMAAIALKVYLEHGSQHGGPYTIRRCNQSLEPIGKPVKV